MDNLIAILLIGTLLAAVVVGLFILFKHAKKNADSCKAMLKQCFRSQK